MRNLHKIHDFGSCDASVGITWHWLHYHKYHHCIFLGWDDQNEMQHDFFLVIWHHWQWYQHHVIPMTLSIAPLYSLGGQDNENNVQHYFFWSCNARMLVSVSQDANSLINGTILFVRSRWSKWDVNFLVMWCHCHQHQHVRPMASQWPHCICLVKIIKIRCNIGTGIGITWCQWHQKWHHCIP